MNDFFPEDQDQRLKRLYNSSSWWLALAGWALIGSALNSILFASLPLKLSQSVWQLQLISAILTFSGFLLVGSLLVCGALLLNTGSTILNERSNLLRRFAGWFAILLFLIVPVQIYSGIKALHETEATENEAINGLRKVIQGMKATSSEAELRTFVAGLPNRPQLPARFDAPFPVIKQRALTNINAQLNTAINQLDESRQQRWEKFIGEVARNSVQAILMALAFNGIAQSRSGKPTLPQTLFQRVRLGAPPIRR